MRIPDATYRENRLARSAEATILAGMNDPLDQELTAIAAAWAAPGQPQATFEAVGEALKRRIGYGLYTITHILRADWRWSDFIPPIGRLCRGWPQADRAECLPRSDVRPGPPLPGKTAGRFRPYFPDHAFIVSLGLGSVINLPLAFDGVPLGSVNILDREGAYEERHVEPALAIARMVVPALLGRSLLVAGEEQ